MKKILLAIMLTFGMASATDFELPQIDTCAQFGIGCLGPVGPEGPQGPQGEQGEQGETGPAGETGATGNDGATGETGAQGEKGEQGIAGTDGKDGVTDYAAINRAIENTRNRIAESNAGAASMAVIDFGSVCEGETAVGLGFGAGDTGAERKYAVGAGAKTGLTDDTAMVVKGYYGTDGHANAVGLGLVHRF